MLSKFGRKIINQNQDSLLNSFFIGLEVERQRTDAQGQISSYPYPQNIGNQQDNPWITNDFMETMTEVVTPTDPAVGILHLNDTGYPALRCSGLAAPFRAGNLYRAKSFKS